MTPETTVADGTERRRIVVFSDGTGNSSAKLFKTNVWRLYQAVDTSQSTTRQLVAYDDGVGTSTFKPLALLGGAFGVGLMRNVLDLYRFICRNYRDGDEIFAFGFSRGAFTIRVLVGLLTTVGVIRRQTDTATLDRLSNDAYRKFRRHFRLPGRGNWMNRLIVDSLRSLRDRSIKWWRKRKRQPYLNDTHLIDVPKIAFVGVWDTVAAYGFPIAEITKGIDRWVWPLSMPDYKLSKKVSRARHALALDDERDTFHPLLWDEVHEHKLIHHEDENERVSSDRMRQVWFTGMHSDVGGGYSDDSLSYVSLVWMANEAKAAGLELRADALEEFQEKADPLGPLHDSRSGVSAYYRYQPRKISARLDPPDPSTRILQDPDAHGHGLLTHVRIHHSVGERIVRGTDGYAPIVLPADYSVEGGPAFELHPGQRAAAQERVWDRVWHRRVSYFVTLGLTLILVALGFVDPPAASCIGPQCVLSPVLLTLADWLPSFASRWVEAYASRPGVFLALALALAWLLRHTGQTEQGLRDLMSRLFEMSRNPKAAAELLEQARATGFVSRLRQSAAYQHALQSVKWSASPGVAAVAIYLIIVSMTGAVLLSLAHRTQLALEERAGRFCQEHEQTALFSTSDMCWRIPNVTVQADTRYRLKLWVTETWTDGSIVTSPEGFHSSELPRLLRIPGALMRRSVSDPWFRPLLRITSCDDKNAFQAVPMALVDFNERLYVGDFTAPIGGSLHLSVNDAVFLWGGDDAFFYTSERGRNRGQARVSVELAPRAATSTEAITREPSGCPEAGAAEAV
jgi:uncharacterized protein (DUF2235 family)